LTGLWKTSRRAPPFYALNPPPDRDVVRVVSRGERACEIIADLAPRTPQCALIWDSFVLVRIDRVGDTAPDVPNGEPQRRIIATLWLHRLGGRHRSARSFAAVDIGLHLFRAGAASPVETPLHRRLSLARR